MSNNSSTSGGVPGTDPTVHRYLRAYELSRAFASREIARRVVKAGWIKAVISAKRFTIYLRVEVEAAQARMERGEMPPPL
jgi:hypothetical protein